MNLLRIIQILGGVFLIVHALLSERAFVKLVFSPTGKIELDKDVQKQQVEQSLLGRTFLYVNSSEEKSPKISIYTIMAAREGKIRLHFFQVNLNERNFSEFYTNWTEADNWIRLFKDNEVNWKISTPYLKDTY